MSSARLRRSHSESQRYRPAGWRGSAAVKVAESAWFCYMVLCSDDALYVGIARDVPERVKRHNWGVGPEFTARRRPVQLIWSELCGSSEAAREREKEIKGWNRKKKLTLLQGESSKPKQVQR